MTTPKEGDAMTQSDDAQAPQDAPDEQDSLDAPTQTEPVSGDFEADVPSEEPAPHASDDWPDAATEADEPVGPAIGERFADVYAERPWLLPAIALCGAVAITCVALLRRR